MKPIRFKPFSFVGAAICALFASLSGQADPAQAAITATGDVYPAYNSTDPWAAGTHLIVGDTGTGTLHIDNASVVNGDGVSIASSPGSTGTVTVDGDDSELNSTNWVTLGNFGDGSLLVRNGGTVTNARGGIYGTTSVATVTGDGSTWTNTLSLHVGTSQGLVFPPELDNHGILNVEAGGLVSSAEAIIGGRSSTNGDHAGTAIVTGSGSTWTNTGDFYVGKSGGTGTLTIEDGGTVSNGNGFLAGETSTATVTGVGSTWNNSGTLYIGQLGNGTLNIQAGASVSSMTGYIGVSGLSSIGIVNVTGPGSTWTNHSDLILGDFASGTLRIESGGAVSSANISIGSQFIGSGNLVEVSGAGSALTVSGSVYVGGDSTSAGVQGTLAVSDTGQAAVADTIKVWDQGTVQGDSDLSATTLLNGGTVAPGNTTGTLSLTGDYEQEPGGTLEINLLSDGLSGIDFGQLDVTGNVTLDGELEVIAAGGFVPGVTGSLDILTSTGAITGAFSNVALPTTPGLLFDVGYATNAVTLTISLEGDLDGDGFVGINDLNIVLGNWNQSVPPANPLADPSGDGFVGIDDLNAVLGNWNAGTPPNTSANIPEPGSSLLFLGLYGLSLARRDSR